MPNPLPSCQGGPHSKMDGGGGRMSHEGSAGARSCRRRLICISKGPPSLHPLPQEWPEVRGFTLQPSASGDPGEGPLAFPGPSPPPYPPERRWPALPSWPPRDIGGLREGLTHKAGDKRGLTRPSGSAIKKGG